MERSGRLHLGHTKLIGWIGVISDIGFLPFTLELMPDYWEGSIGSRSRTKTPKHDRGSAQLLIKQNKKYYTWLTDKFQVTPTPSTNKGDKIRRWRKITSLKNKRRLAAAGGEVNR
jgi:hypothetical protein